MARGFEVTTGLVIQQGLFEDSATNKHKLGTRMQLADGRVFFYAKNGGTTAVAGNCQEALVAVANHTNVALNAAVDIGGKEVTLIDGGTEATDNQYREGYFFVTDGTGEGHGYKVKSSIATSGSASDLLTLTLYDPIRVALVASGTSEGSVMYNPYYGLIIQTGAATNTVGIAPFAATASYYYWLQTFGPCFVLNSAAISTIGEPLVNHTTNGSVGYNFHTITSQEASTYRTVYETLGSAYGQIGVDTEYTPIFLRIAA
jgi:hypothetical protein